MDDIDNDWESFLQNDGNVNDLSKSNTNISSQIIDDNHSIKNIIDESHVDNIRDSNNVYNIPKCSELYISTKTKICYLNKNTIDVKTVFWKIPVIDYYIPKNGVIKKQTKFSSTSKDDVDYIEDKLKNMEHYEEQIIEHIDNPEGRIKYKDQRKISIGMCKKDILSYRSKKKRAFFNCFVVILRLFNKGSFKEIHVKVFNTGKLEIPGIQHDALLHDVLELLVDTLKPYLGNDLAFLADKSETVLINSNFNCGYYIDRHKLHDLLKFKYRINSNFDACSYPGIQSKFYYDNTMSPKLQTGQQPMHKNVHEISFMIFRTGSVLVVGKCEDDILYHIYDFLKGILEKNYLDICSPGTELRDNEAIALEKSNKKKKPRKKVVLFQ
tara:strand:+ start:4281 stop:5426 length:1146 start_codon:yes stop_codon:yes gene_type:complete